MVMTTKDQGGNSHYDATSSPGGYLSPKKRRKVLHACIYCRRSVGQNSLSLPRHAAFEAVSGH